MDLFQHIGILILVVLLYMTGWFAIARRLQRTDAVDTAWGLGFVTVAWTAWLLASRRADFHLFAVALVTIWGVRLSAHITRRNLKKTEDYRYVVYRKKWGERYWPTAYARIFMTQGLLLLIISTPVVALMQATSVDWSWLLVVGFIVWASGIIIEAEADNELTKFVRHKKPGEIMTSGLWKYSRHPNYFGEVSAWWGAAIVAVCCREYWGVLGALVITFLITKVSGIPPLEKHYADNKAFQAYAKRTSVFIPWPPRR